MPANVSPRHLSPPTPEHCSTNRIAFAPTLRLLTALGHRTQHGAHHRERGDIVPAVDQEQLEAATLEQVVHSEVAGDPEEPGEEAVERARAEVDVGAQERREHEC